VVLVIHNFGYRLCALSNRIRVKVDDSSFFKYQLWNQSYSGAPASVVVKPFSIHYGHPQSLIYVCFPQSLSFYIDFIYFFLQLLGENVDLKMPFVFLGFDGLCYLNCINRSRVLIVSIVAFCCCMQIQARLITRLLILFSLFSYIRCFSFFSSN
jgi:hypothetical protein